MNPNDHIIMFVGRIEPLKGIDVLLYALKILIVKNPHLPVKLLIVGGDISQHISKWSAQLRELTKIRKILGLVMNVQFVGQKQQHELVKYYTAADVVVMPSHYESFGMAAAEAMACGTPVITTNATGISNRIDEKRDSLISSANNPLLLASQIENLFTHEDLYSQVKKDALMYVSDLRWPEIASRIDRVYDAVINNEK